LTSFLQQYWQYCGTEMVCLISQHTNIVEHI
jgi:hypothetical protein